MLEKLGIISRLKHEGEDKILIPCLLPENPPAATVMDEVWPAFEDTAQVTKTNNNIYFSYKNKRREECIHSSSCHWASSVV